MKCRLLDAPDMLTITRAYLRVCLKLFVTHSLHRKNFPHLKMSIFWSAFSFFNRLLEDNNQHYQQFSCFSYFVKKSEDNYIKLPSKWPRIYEISIKDKLWDNKIKSDYFKDFRTKIDKCSFHRITLTSRKRVEVTRYIRLTKTYQRNYSGFTRRVIRRMQVLTISASPTYYWRSMIFFYMKTRSHWNIKCSSW